MSLPVHLRPCVTSPLPCVCPAGERLSPYVSHHERLDYGRAAVEARHHRFRRATDTSPGAAPPPLTLEFHALRRPFRLRLRREARVFSADAVLVGPSGRYEPLQTDHLYEGHLEGETRAGAGSRCRCPVFCEGCTQVIQQICRKTRC